MLLIAALTLIWFTGLLTVSTETFTHFLTKPRWIELLRGFVEQSLLFTLTATLWALTILVFGWFFDWPVGFRGILTMLGFAHTRLLQSMLAAIPGWLAHLFLVEWRLVRRQNP